MSFGLLVLTKEIEAKGREIRVHIKKIQALTKTISEETENKVDRSELVIAESVDASTNTDEQKGIERACIENAQRVEELEKELETRKAHHTEAMKTEKKEVSKEINKLKADIRSYETRLESILEDSSNKEKTVFHLHEELRIIKEVNKSIETELIKKNTVPEGEIEEKMGIPDKEDENRKEKGRRKSERGCRFWKRDGKCKYGEDCNFQHKTPAPTKDQTENQQRKAEENKPRCEQEKSKEALDTEVTCRNPNGISKTLGIKVTCNGEQMKVKENPRKDCRFWMKYGKCRFNDKCDYQHPPINPEERKKVDLCRNMAQGKKCSFGERCFFDHNVEGEHHTKPAMYMEAKANNSELTGRSMKIKSAGQKNEWEGTQSKKQINMLCSLANQVKEQSDEIIRMKKMIKNRMH